MRCTPRVRRRSPFACALAAALLVSARPAQAPAQGAPRSSTEAFPGRSWEPAMSPESSGWSASGIAALGASVDSLGSAAFMLVTRGRVVAAWGDTARSFQMHSVRKSFLSALCGIAVSEGKLDTSKTLGLLGIGEKGVTLSPDEKRARVADLLRARSGVYLPAAGENDFMRAGRPARGSHAPGTFWYYNNWDFNALGTIYRQQSGEDIFQALDRRLAKPIGMQEFRPEEGRYILEPQSIHPAYFIRVSARDLARFGLLYLRRGRWREQQVVPAAWVDASVQSYSGAGDQGSRATTTGYGFMWWVRQNSGQRPELGIPDGTFTASGSGGQRLTVIPQIETIVVNLMNTDEPGPRIGSREWDELLARVMAARLR